MIELKMHFNPNDSLSENYEEARKNRDWQTWAKLVEVCESNGWIQKGWFEGNEVIQVSFVEASPEMIDQLEAQRNKLDRQILKLKKTRK